MHASRGFTMQGLLVATAIITILSTAVFAWAMQARMNGRAARSVSDLKQTQVALEYYRKHYNAYPISSGGTGVWDGLYTCWGDSSGAWIPGLASDYIEKLPRSPNLSTDCDNNYIYRSDGTDFKLLWHNPEDCMGLTRQYPEMRDPARTGAGGTTCWAYGVWTRGAASW